jgi:imidazolonepropionase-like amidohydrolase
LSNEQIPARRAFLGLLASTAFAAAARSSGDSTARATAIVADILFPISGPPIRNGVVIVRGGTIAAVAAGLAIPKGAAVLRAKSVMPGIVDPHCHLGCLNEMEEPVDAITPDLRVRDGMDESDPAFERAERAGVTTACMMPGNGNAIAGQGSIYKLGRPLSLVREYAAQKLSLTAAGPQRNPTSRAGVIALIRAAFDGAKRGQAVSSVTQTNLLAGFPSALGERVRALMPVVRGERPVFIHCPNSDDVEAALSLFDAYKLNGCLLHALEGFELRDEIARRRLPVVLGPLTFDQTDRALANAGQLARAGVRVAFCSDAPLTDPAGLRLSASLAVQYGLTPDKALRALTRTPAEILGIERHVGSIQPGMDADLLLLNGDPLDLTTHVETVLCAGKTVYRR